MTAVQTRDRRRPPYITPYEEQIVDLPLTFELHPLGLRLTYRDAVPSDWMFDVLWVRFGTAKGEKPLWKAVHPLRQRLCMMRKLCRVCGESAADPDTGRFWWVLPAAVPENAIIWATYHPPVCKDHVEEALSACPHLRKGSPAVYTVGGCERIGVLADLYAIVDGRLVKTNTDFGIGADEPHLLRRAVAKQLSVGLYDIQPVPFPASG